MTQPYNTMTQGKERLDAIIEMATNTAEEVKKDDDRVGFVTDPQEDLDAREKLTDAKVIMLFKAPFFGQLSSRLPLVNADAWLPTAATDGKHFFFNSKFINMLSDEECVFLFGHEVLHNVYDHMSRFEGKIAKLANVAADYVVNQDLIDQRIGDKITTVPVLHDPKFKGWSMDEVYDYLYDNADKINMQELVDQLLDEHMDDEGDGNGDGKGDIEEDENGNKKSGSKPKLSKEDKKQVRDEIRNAMINAAKAQKAGTLPAGVERLIKDLTEPKMDWRELLQQQIESTIKSDFSWMRPSRKGWHTGAVLPGMIVDQTIDIAITIDLSGSISEQMMRDFISEIKGIMDLYPSFNIKLWTFDTKVYNEMDFDESNADELLEYPFQGGGGTDFMCNWEYMQENDIVPKRLIMFTDGYPCGDWGEEEYCDTVFIIHDGGYGGGHEIIPPWGLYAHYNDPKDEEGNYVSQK